MVWFRLFLGAKEDVPTDGVHNKVLPKHNLFEALFAYKGVNTKSIFDKKYVLNRK